MATAITFKSESGDFYTYVSHDNATKDDIKAEIKQEWWTSELLYMESYSSHELSDEDVLEIAGEVCE